MTTEINKEITRITGNSVEHCSHFFSIRSTICFGSEDSVTRVKQWWNESNHWPPFRAEVTKEIQSPISFNHAHRNRFTFALFLMLRKEVAMLISGNSFVFTELIKYT
jgi:hypothetical protein